MSYSLLHQQLVDAPPELLVASSATMPRLDIAQLRHDCSRLIHQLQSHKAQEQYCLVCDQAWWLLVGLLSCQQLGKKVIIPSNIQSKAVAEHKQKWSIISDRSELADQTEVHYLSQQSESEVKPLKTWPFKSILASEAALCLYTSGSTGHPKPIDKSLAQLEIEAQQLELHFPQAKLATSVIGSVAHYHIYGLLFRLIWPMLSQRRFHNELILNLNNLDSLEQTILVSSPALLARLKQAANNSPCLLFSSGGPLSAAHAQQANQVFGCLPIEVYGSTETGGIAWRQQTQANSPWQLFNCVQASLNEQCLMVHSAYLPAEGYQTQDQAEFVNIKQFQLIGRCDRIVKLSEKRISLDQIERCVNSLPSIHKSVAIVLDQQQRIGLVVELSSSAEADYQQLGHHQFWRQLRHQLLGKIETVALPRQLRIVSQIPVNLQGKQDFSAIQELFTQ